MSTLRETFDGFRNELDEHHARKERIVKHSRDITAESKKAIFTLLRVSTTNDTEAVLHDARLKLDATLKIYNEIRPDLEGESFWRYRHSIAPGVEEFVEAFLLYKYIETNAVATQADVEAELGASITAQEYLGGIGDLTGELMRLGISSSNSPSSHSKDGSIRDVARIRDVMRDIESQVQKLSPYLNKKFDTKLSTLQQNLSKVENAAYSNTIKNSEFAR